MHQCSELPDAVDIHLTKVSFHFAFVSQIRQSDACSTDITMESAVGYEILTEL